MEIKGRVVLITGANRGLGRALVDAFLAAGAAKVYAGVRNADGVSIPGAEVIPLDVTSPASVASAAERCGDVAIVVNNAGIVGRGSVLADEALDAARAQLETNLFGVWSVSRAFAPVVGRNGGGAFVNILSVLSWLTVEGTAGYSASKAAAWAFTNGLRQELAGQGIQVMGVHVGLMDTDMAKSFDLPKTPPAVIAGRIVAALESGARELLADEMTRQVKGGLSLTDAPYL